jgi:threonine dehydratase
MRLGLPSFKILGASWGTFKAVVNKYGFPLDSDLPTLKMALSSHPTTLLAATEGNHGRAVARMGSLLGVQTQIFVSKEMHSATVQAIRNEGAIVTQIDGPYDLAVKIAYDASLKCNGILVQDTAFPGYEDIPAVCLHYLESNHR